MCSLLQWDWKMPYLKVIEILPCFATNEKWCQIWICSMDNLWFCFIFNVWVYFSYKTEKFQFWKSLKYFNIFGKNRCSVRFEYVPCKNVWFCFISIVWFHFSYKTEKFWFLKSSTLMKYFNVFWSKKWHHIWVSCQAVSDLV